MYGLTGTGRMWWGVKMSIFICAAVHIFLGPYQPKSVVLVVLRYIIRSNESQMIHFRSTLLFGVRGREFSCNFKNFIPKLFNGILNFSCPKSMWTKIIVIKKRCANSYSSCLLRGEGKNLGDVTGYYYSFLSCFSVLHFFR